MTEQPVGPRCGNNPNVQLTDGDRKAVADFKARLALQTSARPHLDRAAWVDGDPLMEVIAAAVWERCARDDEDMPQLVCDDPRTIAAFAAAVARAQESDGVAPATDRAAVDRVRAVLETEAVVGRSALEYRGLIVSALMAAESVPAVAGHADGETERVVAYRSRDGRALFCTRHSDELGAYWTPVLSEDLPDGGICTHPECGVDVLIPQETDRG